MIGNILDVKDGIICHQVNAQGVMGSGVAKEIRARYPQVWTDYNTTIWTLEKPMGQVIFTKITPDLWVASIVGQEFYGNDGKRYTSYDALADGFQEVARRARIGDFSVHYPLIGCGLGGAKWAIVSAIINAELGSIPHTLWTLS